MVYIWWAAFFFAEAADGVLGSVEEVAAVGGGLGKVGFSQDLVGILLDWVFVLDLEEVAGEG